MGIKLKTAFEYLIGVDGGGTKTHIRVERPDGSHVADGSSGPSALMHGTSKSWCAIVTALDNAFLTAGITRPPYPAIAAGCGLSGVNNPQWGTQFTEQNPGFGALAIGTDAFTTLLGAHLGQPGVVVAIGTGSVGEVLLADGSRREVGGWGFQTGDEASGGWIGLRAANHVERALDGRAEAGPLSKAIISFCGGGDEFSTDQNRQRVIAWVNSANQSIFAQLAPLVVAHAGHDQAAQTILRKAGVEIAEIARALDPTQQLPIALCGGLASPLRAYLPEPLKSRAITPRADAATGALLLLRRQLATELAGEPT
ncbi:N-acetylglucosamine kinase of eukaryotic type [Collimonas arenae]|uniref:N-acetylglucosamine kinase of eukaryotic type n=1 Tax=Collimonas arenae TaxID=279058 RepID=A0A0A1FBU3_9BURK|nr:N-acetylglucosamine kinase of eukaryotic type [Collimonas arenae]